MTKCVGCGAVLQNVDENSQGFTRNIDNPLCQRCFNIKHYNSYISVEKENSEYLKILEKIKKTNDLVVLVADLFSLNSLNEIDLPNPVILAVTKEDLLPRNTDEIRFLNKLSSKLNIVGKIVVSSKNNKNLDELYDLILKNKKSKNVYVAGFTSSGKSTLINKMVYNYGNNPYEITTSVLPSTTLDLIEVVINDDLVLIDTPGLLDEGSIVLSASKELFKKIVPRKEIRPIVIQVKRGQTIIVDDIFRIDVKKTGSLVFFMSNELKIMRYYKENNKLKNLKKIKFNKLDGMDIVIKGLGFIKIKEIDELELYVPDNINVSRRKSIM